MKTWTSNIAGILITIVATAMMTGHDVAVKLGLSKLPAIEIMFVRNVLANIMVLIWIVAAGEARALVHLKNFSIQLRSFITGMSVIAYVVAILGLPLSDLRAVILTMPLMLTAGSALFLHEKVSWGGWVAIAIGFLGVLFVIRPSFENTLNFYFFFALISAVAGAAGQLMVRSIPLHIPILILAFATGLWGIFVSGLLCLIEISSSSSVLHWPPPETWLPFFIASLLFTIGGYGITFSLRYADLSVLAPFRYAPVVWALVADIMIWHHWPDEFSIMGSILIIAAGLYVFYRQRKKPKEAPTAEPAITNRGP